MWVIIAIIAISFVVWLIKGFAPSEEYQAQQERERQLEEKRRQPDQIVEVSLAELVAHPYFYKYDYTHNKKIITLTDKMVISSNLTDSRKFHLMRSTGDGKYNYAVTPTIDVYYGNLESLEKLVMLGNYEKITIQGKVNVDNYGHITITATNVTWWNW